MSRITRILAIVNPAFCAVPRDSSVTLTSRKIAIGLLSMMTVAVLPENIYATNLTGVVSSPVSVTDTINISSVTNTASITTTSTFINFAGTNNIQADITSGFIGTFQSGHNETQSAGTVNLPFSYQGFAGSYVLNNGTLSVGNWFSVGAGSTFTQNGGAISVQPGINNTGGADIAGAEQTGTGAGTATLNLNNGTFQTSNMLVGNDSNALGRKGIVVQEAGSTVTISSSKGRFPGNPITAPFAISVSGSTAGESSYTLKGGSLTVNNGNTQIYQWGNFAGYGTVTSTSARTLDNSGKVVANGFGSDSNTLNLSQYGTIANSTENGVERSVAGWYAQNHGRLTLPTLAVSAGSSSVNWGESSGDSTLDLVNSVNVAFSGATAGNLSISLLATDRADVPSGLIDPIGIWNLTASAAFASANLTFRYDDALAALLGLNESNLKLFHYVGGAWVNVTSSVDTTNNWITGIGITSFSPFAIAGGVVSVPEPTSISLMIIGCCGVVAVRRAASSRRTSSRR